MSIARIVVPLTGGKRDKDTLATAFATAKPFHAHVVALFVSPDPRLTLTYTGVPVSPSIVQDIIDSAEKMNREAAKATHLAFDEAATLGGVEIVRTPKNTNTATCSFLHMEGYFPSCVSETAKLSDLVIFGSITNADSPDLSEAFAETLIKTERPVLLAPKLPAKFPGTVAIAWDGSVTAASALIGAMPFLEKAEKIVLVSCCPAKSDKADLRHVEQYLALHGLSCTGETVEPGKRSIGEALLDGARGADLLVMGGYGHSRLGETLFGGVTQHVRAHGAMPVLMIH